MLVFLFAQGIIIFTCFSHSRLDNLWLFGISLNTLPCGIILGAPITAELPFNPIVVQFKPEGTHKGTGWFDQFQSYPSAIQTVIWCSTCVVARGLSILSQFDLNAWPLGAPITTELPFNPIIVQFKRAHKHNTTSHNDGFQSYHSSIQTPTLKLHTKS